MFLLNYSKSGGFIERGWFCGLWLIPVIELYLTDFLNRIFLGENTKNHEFFGVEKMKAAAVYLFYFNYSVRQ
jgi:hypothetical protein